MDRGHKWWPVGLFCSGDQWFDLSLCWYSRAAGEENLCRLRTIWHRHSSTERPSVLFISRLMENRKQNKQLCVAAFCTKSKSVRKTKTDTKLHHIKTKAIKYSNWHELCQHTQTQTHTQLFFLQLSHIQLAPPTALVQFRGFSWVQWLWEKGNCQKKANNPKMSTCAILIRWN